MIHNEVYKRFQSHCPLMANQVKTWFPNGLNSIRVALITGKEYVFTVFTSTDDVMLEPKNCFVNRMRAENEYERRLKKGKLKMR